MLIGHNSSLHRDGVVVAHHAEHDEEVPKTVRATNVVDPPQRLEAPLPVVALRGALPEVDVAVLGDHVEAGRQLELSGNRLVDDHVGSEPLRHERPVEEDAYQVPHDRLGGHWGQQPRGVPPVGAKHQLHERQPAHRRQQNEELDPQRSRLGAVELGRPVHHHAEHPQQRGRRQVAVQRPPEAVHRHELRRQDRRRDQNRDPRVVDAREPAAQPQAAGPVERVPEHRRKHALHPRRQEHKHDQLGGQRHRRRPPHLRPREVPPADVHQVQPAQQMRPDVRRLVVPPVPVHHRRQRLHVRVVEPVPVDDVPVLPPGERQLVVVQVPLPPQLVRPRVVELPHKPPHVHLCLFLLHHLQLRRLHPAKLLLQQRGGRSTEGARPRAPAAVHQRVRVRERVPALHLGLPQQNLFIYPPLLSPVAPQTHQILVVPAVTQRRSAGHLTDHMGPAPPNPTQRTHF